MSPQNAYVELTPNVIVFGDSPFEKINKAKGGNKGGVLMYMTYKKRKRQQRCPRTQRKGQVRKHLEGSHL